MTPAKRAPKIKYYFQFPKIKNYFQPQFQSRTLKLLKKTQISAYVITQTEMFLGRMSVVALL